MFTAGMPLVIMFITLRGVLALIAYDCQTPSTNITIISLKDVAQCPSPEDGYATLTKHLRVLQKERFTKVHVYTCLFEVTRIIVHCGAFSHNSLVQNGLYTTMHKVGGEGCRLIHRHHQYDGWTGRLIGDLKSNSTTTVSFTMAGYLGNDGTCEGTTYVENGNTWRDVVVTATAKIYLTDYEATLRLEQNEVVLRGGIVCPYLDNYCIDVEIGETVWEVVSHEKCSSYVELYRGPGSLVKPLETSKYDTVQNYIVIEQENRVFALSLVKALHICEEDYWLTEHPQLVVVLNDLNTFKPISRQLQVEDDDLRAYTDSKFLYMEHALKSGLRNLYAHAVYRRCQLRREILRNRLTMAPLSPNTISAIIKENLGYVGKVAGEVLYIMQCTPRIATLRKVDQCYLELPVTVDNTSYYMSPITRILQRYAESIPCNPVIPPTYYINDEWISFTPTPVRVRRDPVELQVDEEAKLTFAPLTSVSKGGPYTEKEIQQAQDAMLFGTERKAITNLIAAKVLGQETSGHPISMLKLFSAADMEQLAQSTLSKLWGWFTWLGTFTSGILGLLIMWKILKFIIEVVINAIAIHRVHGLSVKLIASLWDTLTVHILNMKKTKKPNLTEEQEDTSSKEISIELTEPTTLPKDPTPYTPVQQQLATFGV